MGTHFFCNVSWMNAGKSRCRCLGQTGFGCILVVLGQVPVFLGRISALSQGQVPQKKKMGRSKVKFRRQKRSGLAQIMSIGKGL